jgi:hypothetical protein
MPLSPSSLAWFPGAFDMADNIVDSLFGPQPWQVQQQQNESMRAEAERIARMDGFQQAKYGIGRGAGMIAGAGMEAAGYANPAVAQAQMNEHNMAGLDPSDPKSLLLRASQIQDPRMKWKLIMAAKQMQAKAQEAALALKKDAREDVKMDRDAVWKHEETLARLEETSRANRSASEDRRLSIEQRDVASRRADATDRVIVQMQADSRAAIAAAKGEQPPKNLTREARLKWEVENGRIDQETYDAAMAASPGSKLQYEKNAASKSAEIGFKSVEDNIAKLYDPQTKEIKPEADALFGKYAQYRPQIAMSQESVDAANALESLTNQVMMANLADAKERVGQSFGSMQVQEWDKFTQQLTSLKRGLSPKAAAEAMEYINNFIATKRSILKTAMGKGGSSAPAEPQLSINKSPNGIPTGRTFKVLGKEPG